MGRPRDFHTIFFKCRKNKTYLPMATENFLKTYSHKFSKFSGAYQMQIYQAL